MFGFPTIDSSIKNSFKRNFLRNVSFQIRFDESEKIFENKSKIHTLFESKYPRLNDVVSNSVQIQIDTHETPIVNSIKGKGFALRSNDGNKTLNFSKDSIDINIVGVGYKNFDEILNFEILKIKELLISLDIQKINRIAIRKINIIGVVINENTNLTLIAKDLLNQKISNGLDCFPKDELINQNINNVNYLSGTSGLNLKMGHTLQPKNPKIGHLICDIDRYDIAINEVEKLMTIFQEINDEIFEVFIWFLNEKSIRALTT